MQRKNRRDFSSAVLIVSSKSERHFEAEQKVTYAIARPTQHQTNQNESGGSEKPVLSESAEGERDEGNPIARPSIICFS
jgi:hypothetical protein